MENISGKCQMLVGFYIACPEEILMGNMDKKMEENISGKYLMQVGFYIACPEEILMEIWKIDGNYFRKISDASWLLHSLPWQNIDGKYG